MLNRFTISAFIFGVSAVAIISSAESVESVSYKSVDQAAIRGQAYFNSIEAAKEEQIAIEIERERLKQMSCLYLTVYGESRGESHIGQELVANVILNRVASKHYPNTICEVVKQPYQFSMWNKGDPNASKALKAFTSAPTKEVYAAIIASQKALKKSPDDRLLPVASVNYHSDKIDLPAWAYSKKLKRIEVVGSHIFYESVSP